jgi:predicted N-acetyltransferase YhbS
MRLIWLRRMTWKKGSARGIIFLKATTKPPSHVHRFYGKSCLYLDNLCVDFRLQKSGIGAALVDWGIVKSNEAELDIKTEAAPDGVPFYLKMGFERIGDWVVHMPDPDDNMVLAVMQRKHS